jgi:hypothetical protein
MGLISRPAREIATMAGAFCPVLTHRQATKVLTASVMSESSSQENSDPLAGNGGLCRIAYQHWLPP